MLFDAVLGVQAAVVFVALILSGRFFLPLWRHGSKQFGAALLSLAAVVVQALLPMEHGLRLLTHTMPGPPEWLSTFRVSTLWLFVAPFLLRASFKRSPLEGSSRSLNLVRSWHVAAWTSSALPTFFSMMNI